MKPWLVRLGLVLALLGFTACSGPTTKQKVDKLDPSVKPQEPPKPPPIPKDPPPRPTKTR